MKNKLLTTTAIAGLLVSGTAFAQTTVTGNLDFVYKGISNKTKLNTSAPDIVPCSSVLIFP